MANFPVAVGEAVALPFPLFEEDGVTPLTGLVNGDFTKTLLKGTAAQANPVTVTESAVPGRYVVEFTPDSPGTWYVEVWAADDANEAIWAGYVQAGLTGSIVYPSVIARTVECP